VAEVEDRRSAAGVPSYRPAQRELVVAPIRVDQERCKGCGACVDACPTRAIYLVEDRAVIDGALCRACEACLAACPQGALSLQAPVAVGSSVRRTDQARVVSAPASVPTVRSRPVWVERVLPVLGAVVSLAAQEVIPRIASLLASDAGTSRLSSAVGGGGYRHRQRHRGKHT